MKLKFLLVIFSCVSLFSCAIGPLNSSHSARSLGDGNNNINASIMPIGVEYSRGVSDNVDLGVAVELQFTPLGSVWAKYSIVNNPTGVSYALTSGLFYSDGVENASSKGGFLGAIVSHRKDKMEFYFSGKLNRVNWESGSLFTSKDSESIWYTDNGEESETFNYLQGNLGMSYWVSPKFNFDISGVCISLIKDGGTCAPMLGFGWAY